ncbi:MAG: hypothetical protein CMF50_04295 [Legionellales bacterium]|nr:hypothetical protein [Legionellales bacterium]|tara:strand:- start:15443 stop:16000 length:558 start_codon:yes stop_codon:yes gene_type:complete
METRTHTSKHRRLIMVGLWLLFAVPVIAAWLIYYNYDKFHFGTTNYGTLIEPPVDLQTLVKQQSLSHKWHLLFSDNACCDATCQQHLEQFSQMRIALGKDRDRLDLHYVSANNSCKITQARDFHQLVLTETERAGLQQVLPSGAQTNQVYLVDPQGYLFMLYAQDTDPMNVLKDLKILLRASQIG